MLSLVGAYQSFVKLVSLLPDFLLPHFHPKGKVFVLLLLYFWFQMKKAADNDRKPKAFTYISASQRAA